MSLVNIIIFVTSDNVRISKRQFMVKNVKIALTTHRQLSIKASQLMVKKGDLCSALVEAALARLTDTEILDYLSHVPPNNEPDDDT